MFDTSNWIYLAASFGLGFGIRGLIHRVAKVNREKLPVTSVGESQEQDKQDLEKQLLQTHLAYQMVQEMGAFKAGFLARTTHALRSPLNGLIGLHQLILSDLCENPEEEREFIQQALERALKLLKLIDEILNVARLQAGTNRLNIQPFSVIDVLKETHNLTAILAENRSYKYDITFPQEDVYALVDPYWLRYTLVSLVETAIAGMEEGGISLHTQVCHRQKSLRNNLDNLDSHTLQIYLDVPSHALPPLESIDLATAETLTTIDTNSNQPNMSPGMKIVLTQNILEVMGGKLEIYAHPEQTDITRVLISVPASQ